MRCKASQVSRSPDPVFEYKLFSCIQTAERHSGVVNLNHTYEKICLVINHRPNRHCVRRFLHATTGDNCNFDYSGDSRFAIAIAGKEEEDHGQEEGQDRSVAFAC
jgi:hypothetical protein